MPLLLAIGAGGCMVDVEPTSETEAELTGPDRCDFSVSQMTPGVDSQTAFPSSRVEVRFTHAISAGSVNDTTVRLVERESQRVVPVDLVALSRSVTLIPRLPLASYSRYTVEVSGVTKRGTRSCATEFSGRFFTRPNFPSTYLRYSANGLERAFLYSWDAAAESLTVDHYQPGPDGVMGTADDSHDTRAENDFDLTDKVYSRVRSVGPDLLLDTPDDHQVNERTISFGPAGPLSVTVTSFGVDGVIGTADDVTTNETYSYDAGDRYVGSCTGTVCYGAIYDGNDEKYYTSTAPGPDGQWLTADDVYDSEWTLATYDANGLWLGSETHALAADGSLTTSPGSLISYTSVINVGGQAVEIEDYAGPGPDGTWFTADDEAVGRSEFSYNPRLQVDYQSYTLAGADGLLDTADDRLRYEYIY